MTATNPPAATLANVPQLLAVEIVDIPKALATRDRGEIEISISWRSVLDRFFDARQGSRGGAAKTERAYRRALELFFAWSGLTSPAQIAPSHLATYRRHLAETAGRATQAQSVSAIRAFIGWCRVFEARMPSADAINATFRVPSAPVARPYQVLSGAETAELGAVTASHPRDRAAIGLLLGAGLRLSEAANLRVENLVSDSTGSLLLSVAGKGGKNRTVPIGADLARYLLVYLEVTGRKLGDVGPLLLAEDHRAASRPAGLTDRALDLIVRRTLAAAGVVGKVVSAHSLRHTFALRFLRSGGDVVALAKVLGHSSIAITHRYVDHLKTAELGASMPATF